MRPLTQRPHRRSIETRHRLGSQRARALAASVVLAAATSTVVFSPASPASAGGGPVIYEVTTTEDLVTAPGSALSLREAVSLADADGANSEIRLQLGATYELDLCNPAAPDESTNASGDLDHSSAHQLRIVGFSAIVRQTCTGERVLHSLNPATQVLVLSTTITGGRTTGTGGGIFSNGPITLLGSVVEGNVGGGAGGGGVASFFDVTVNGTTFQDNRTSGHGGGIFANEQLVLHGSTVVGNVAASDGGGAYGGDGVDVQRSTVTRNLAFGAGGGVRSAEDVDLLGATVVANRAATGANLRASDDITYEGSVLALGSGGSDCASSQVASGGGNVGVDATCGTALASDTPSLHPQISLLADHGGGTDTMRPVVGSPSIDRYGAPCATAHDQRAEARPQGPACDSGAYEGPAAACSPTFPDVGATHPFFVEVCWLAQSGITGGYPNGTFQPANPISRQAMAAFLHRLALSPPVLTGAPTFTDVSGSHPFFEEVEWMHQEAITEGFGDGTFRPLDPVSRQAMAAFLHRVAGEPGPAGAPPYFSDVPNSHPFFADVQWMYQEGVTTGFGDGTFHPSDPVSRQAMAAFLERMADEVVLAGL
jgi:predicted outer membrane repeat protein